MKRILGLLLAMLFWMPNALADADGYWTRNADWYYHLSEYCGGAEGMVPISLDGAEAFGKYPCPACISREFGDEIQAVIESGAGAVVVRIPDSRMGDQWFDETRNYADDASYEGGEAYRALGDYLSGEAYISFLNDCQSSGGAQASGCKPRVWGSESALVMSSRHLGGAWYFVVRPGAIMRESLEMGHWTMNWRTDAYQLRMEDGALICDYTTNTQTEQVDLKLEVQSTEPVFDQAVGELYFYVTNAMNEYIALIMHRLDGNIPEAELRIGEGGGIPLTSHVNEDWDTYCCVLTEAELNALRNGATAELQPRASWPAYYFGTPYAVQYDEEQGAAIIDRDGKRAVDFGTYEGIEREASDKTFRCVIPEEMRYVYLDGNTLEQVREERDGE